MVTRADRDKLEEMYSKRIIPPKSDNDFEAIQKKLINEAEVYQIDEDILNDEIIY